MIRLALYIISPILLLGWLTLARGHLVASIVCAALLFILCTVGYIFSTRKVKFLLIGQLYLSTASGVGGLINWETFYPFHLLFCIGVITYNLIRNRIQLRNPISEPLFWMALLNAYLFLNLLFSAVLFNYSSKNLLIWGYPLCSALLSSLAFMTHRAESNESPDTFIILGAFATAILIASGVGYFLFPDADLGRLNFAAYGLSTTNYILHVATIAWVACYCLTGAWGIGLVLLTLAQVLAQSRGAILVLAFALLWILVRAPLNLLTQHRYRLLRLVQHALVTCAVCCIAVLSFFPGRERLLLNGTESFVERWQRTLESGMEDVNTEARIAACQYHLDTYVREGNPLFGAGVGRIPYEDNAVQPHNFFVLGLYEGGMVGLGLFCTVLLVTWLRLPVLRLFIICYALATSMEILTQTVPMDTLFSSIVFTGFCSVVTTQRTIKSVACPKPFFAPAS